MSNDRAIKKWITAKRLRKLKKEELIGILIEKDAKVKKMNEYEKACKEFLKGCSIAGPKSVHGLRNQEDCPECLKAFCDHIRKLKGEAD